MRRVARVDRDDKCCIEKEPHVGVQPAVAQVARTKDAAIAAWIVRSHAAIEQKQKADKTQDQAMHLNSLLPSSATFPIWAPTTRPSLPADAADSATHGTKGPNPAISLLTACAISLRAPGRPRPCARRSAPPTNSS